MEFPKLFAKIDGKRRKGVSGLIGPNLGPKISIQELQIAEK